VSFEPPEVKQIGNMHDLLSYVCACVEEKVASWTLEIRRGDHRLTVAPMEGHAAPYGVAIAGPGAGAGVWYRGCRSMADAMDKWFAVMRTAGVPIPDAAELQEFARDLDAIPV